jgi:hypothetical protein
MEALLLNSGVSPYEASAILKDAFGSPETYESQVEEYEQEVGAGGGLKFHNLDRLGLVPSCEWLQALGVLTETDTAEIREIRDHRNHIAHRLPHLLVYKGWGVDVNRLERIRELLVKIETFWARNSISIDHPEIYEVPDEDIVCGRVFLMDRILQAVADYMEEVGRAAEQAHAADLAVEDS